jgi:hypothetical protein
MVNQYRDHGVDIELQVLKEIQQMETKIGSVVISYIQSYGVKTKKKDVTSIQKNALQGRWISKGGTRTPQAVTLSSISKRSHKFLQSTG